jgi:peroxiredoxin Q/BCP
MIETGEPAPPFALTDAAGKRVALQDLAGRDVVLYFYPKDDTPGCTKEACGFRDVWTELQEMGVEVFGVSPDSAESHTRFAEKYGLPFRLLSDPDKHVMAAYGAWGEKTLYGRLTTGVIRSTVWIGPDSRVRRHWARVPDAEKHPDQVLAALKAER